jgi:hypothetical protein
MYFATTIRTSFGPRHLPPPSMVRVYLTRRELGILVRELGRDSVKAEHAGRFAAADSLALRAVTLRDAAR